MALDPSIVLSGRIPDSQQTTRNALSNVRQLQQIQEAPFRQDILRQQGQLNEQKLGAFEQQQMILGVQTAINSFERGDSNGVVRAILDTVPHEEQQQELAEFNNNPAAYIAQAKDMIGAFKSQQQRTAKTQFGAQATFKDSEGNLFFGTTKQNPNTGQVESVLSSVDGSSAQPVGKVEQTGSFGQTAAEKVIQKGDEASAAETGKLEVKLKKEPTLASATDAAKAAIKLSTKTFERLEPLQQNLVNIDDAIRLIDEGAATGPIISRLPSIRKSSIELDTLQKKLGLDVIASTTFGALSEGEREFALSTALPKNLQGPDLRKWLQRKKVTQQKMIKQLGEAASFLGTPGNTIADYIELTKLQSLDDAEKAPPKSKLQPEPVQQQDGGAFELPGFPGVQIRKIK